MFIFQNEKRVPDEWQARQAKSTSQNEKKNTEQEEAHFGSQPLSP